jgi:hemerythrin
MSTDLPATTVCPIIGVPFMDADHRGLTAATDRLLAAVAANSDIAAINEAFVDLVSLTLTHFDREELSMAENGYADYGPHKAEHARLVEQISAIADRIKADNHGLTSDLTNFLSEWLCRHVETFDKAYAHHLREVGAAATSP